MQVFKIWTLKRKYFDLNICISQGCMRKSTSLNGENFQNLATKHGTVQHKPAFQGCRLSASHLFHMHQIEKMWKILLKTATLLLQSLAFVIQDSQCSSAVVFELSEWLQSQLRCHNLQTSSQLKFSTLLEQWYWPRKQQLIRCVFLFNRRWLFNESLLF